MDMTKSLNFFGDLDLIFKVTLENQIAKFRPKILECTLSSDWVSGFTQICMNSISGHDNKLIKVWRPLPDFQGHIRIKTAKFRAKRT